MYVGGLVFCDIEKYICILLFPDFALRRVRILAFFEADLPKAGEY